MGIDPLLTLLLMLRSKILSPRTLEKVSWVWLLLAVPAGLIYGFSCSLVQSGPFLSAGISGIVTLIVAGTVLHTKISLCCPHSFGRLNFSGV